MRRWNGWPMFLMMGLILPAGLAAQDAAELREAYWTELHLGSQAAQTCLQDVVYEGRTEVPCEEMLPAFHRASELAEKIQEQFPDEAYVEIAVGREVTLENFALSHQLLADSVALYLDRTDEEARSRKVNWGGRLMAWRTVIERFLPLLPGPPRPEWPGS